MQRTAWRIGLVNVIPAALVTLVTLPALLVGQWHYGTFKDEFTDQTSYYILHVVTGVSSRSGDVHGSLAWKCDQRSEPPYISLLLGTHVGSSITVDYRFDTTAAVLNQHWGRSDSGDVVFIDSHYVFGDVDEFTGRAKTASKLLIRVRDSSDGEVLTYTVDLRGFTAAYARLPCKARFDH
jgi:hypothetical protein